MEKELKKVKAELKDILSITPNDNLRFLQNQITIGNIEVKEVARILTILKRVELGIAAQENRINKLRIELKKTKDGTK